MTLPPHSFLLLLLLPLLAVLLLSPVPARAWIQYPPTGFASLTHYTIPPDFVAACGCTGASTHFPTAALSQAAYGSSTSFGPGCGRCFRLALVNTFLSTPPFVPPAAAAAAGRYELVVKITDLCPLSRAGWCDATETKLNPAGHQLNFDLAFPSTAISPEFFPSNQSLYGYKDFGVWNITYEAVSCKEWAGWKEPAALGSAASLGLNGCCPADPDYNVSCPSYSDKNGIPPDTRANAGLRATAITPFLLLSGLAVAGALCYLL